MENNIALSLNPAFNPICSVSTECIRLKLFHTTYVIFLEIDYFVLPDVGLVISAVAVWTGLFIRDMKSANFTHHLHLPLMLLNRMYLLQFLNCPSLLPLRCPFTWSWKYNPMCVVWKSINIISENLFTLRKLRCYKRLETFRLCERYRWRREEIGRKCPQRWGKQWLQVNANELLDLQIIHSSIPSLPQGVFVYFPNTLLITTTTLKRKYIMQ